MIPICLPYPCADRKYLYFHAMRRPHTIGITGGSGSGKSYLTDILRGIFKEDEVAIISQDNYYRKRELQERDENGVINFDLPRAFLLEEFSRDVDLLVRGESVERMEYTYNNALATPEVIRIDPAPVLIVEGLFIMHRPDVRELVDLSVFVEVHDVLKLKRRIMRDQTERNYPVDDVLYRYEHHVLPAYREYIDPYKDLADLIINNDTSMDAAVRVLSGYIRDVLRSKLEQ